MTDATPRVRQFSAQEGALPQMTKEDYTLMLLEQMLRHQQQKEGALPALYPFEAETDLAAGAETTIRCDFPHDGWVLYFRADAAVVLEFWPGSSVPSQAPELRNNSAVRITSTGPILAIKNTGSNAAHWFAIAVSLAECEFYSLA